MKKFYGFSKLLNMAKIESNKRLRDETTSKSSDLKNKSETKKRRKEIEKVALRAINKKYGDILDFVTNLYNTDFSNYSCEDDCNEDEVCEDCLQAFTDFQNSQKTHREGIIDEKHEIVEEPVKQPKGQYELYMDRLDSLPNLTEHNRNIIMDKLDDMKEPNLGMILGIPGISGGKQKNKWLEYVLNILESDHPYDFGVSKKDSNSRINKSLTTAMETLNNEVYGLDQPKEQILLQIYDQILTGNQSSGNIIVLVGPPGIGKTQLMQTISKGTGIPYQRFSLGGANDVSSLKGFSKTWKDSQPGRIIDARKQLGCNNGIICIDELDKIGGNTKGDQVSNMLLHLLDPSQNHQWTDDWTGNIHFDLSKILFFGTANDENKINPILRDRCQIIKLPGYTKSDKQEILSKFFIPKFEKRYGVKKDDVNFTSQISSYLIDKYSTDEKGVRNLERALRNIFKKINILRRTYLGKRRMFGKKFSFSFAIDNWELPLNLSESMIKTLLKDMDSSNEKPEDISKLRLYL